MKRHLKRLNLTLLIFASLVGNVLGQVSPVDLPIVVFNDKILERTVGDYMVGSHSKIGSVTVARQGSLHTYEIQSVFFYDEVHPKQPTAWGKYVLVFYASSDLQTVANFVGVPIYKNLLTYLRPMLSNVKTPVRGMGDNVFAYQLLHGLTWWLKVENGREIGLRDSEGHDTEDFLNIPIPPK